MNVLTGVRGFGREVALLPITAASLALGPVAHRIGQPLTLRELEHLKHRTQLQKAMVGAAAVAEAARLRPKPGTSDEAFAAFVADNRQFATAMVDDALVKADLDKAVPDSDIAQIIAIAHSVELDPADTPYVDVATIRHAAALLLQARPHH